MAGNEALQDTLNTALEREKKAQQFYLSAAGKTGNDKGKQMFKWLAGVEQTHINRLSQQIDSLTGTGKPQGIIGARVERVKRSELPPAPEASGPVASNAGELDALATAIQAEKEAIALYNKTASDNSDPAVKSLLAELAKDEEEHLLVVEEEYNWLKKSGEYFTIHRFKLPVS